VGVHDRREVQHLGDRIPHEVRQIARRHDYPAEAADTR
jgi:hypothetical protein